MLFDYLLFLLFIILSKYADFLFKKYEMIFEH